jgi:uncharacterized protein YbjQ (UPF0145 family)
VRGSRDLIIGDRDQQLAREVAEAEWRAARVVQSRAERLRADSKKRRVTRDSPETPLSLA